MKDYCLSTHLTLSVQELSILGSMQVRLENCVYSFDSEVHSGILHIS